MSDDQNTIQNPISEENSIPPSPQEPTVDIPVPATDSTPVEMPLEAPESPINVDNAVPINNDNPDENSPVSTPSPEESKPEELPAEGIKTEEIPPISAEPVQTPESRTAQIPVNEPLVKISLARELLVKARNMIQSRKRKKLDRIMNLFSAKSKITNDEVEKFLHISDATATRYLSQLEKENKIKQTGKTGHSVFYSKI